MGIRMNILHLNNVELLKLIPSGSVDCCITSPPYQEHKLPRHAKRRDGHEAEETRKHLGKITDSRSKKRPSGRTPKDGE